MKGIALLLIAHLLMAGTATAQSLAFTDVTVINVAGGVAEPGRTVVLTGDRIAAVGASDEVEVPRDATVIDGTGKFLIPGLWDMHVHSGAGDLTRSIDLPLYVAHGVTGVRELSGSPGQLRLRVEIAKGELLGPRMVVGSPYVDGPNPWPGEGEVRVSDAGEAREMVDSLKAQGYDFIKTYQFLSPEAYRALHKRARQFGMEVSGEIPMSVSLWEAAAMGHRTVEHLTGVELACSRQEEELRMKYRRQVEEISADTTLRTHIPVWNRTEWEPLETWDAEKCRALYRHLAAHETWVVPTLVIQRLISHASDPAIKDDPRQRYLPASWWDPARIADYFDPDRQLRPTFEHRLRSISDLHRAGVGILAGSDMAGGFPLHDELALFVEAGLTPLEALRTATLNPARYLVATDSLGTLEEGKLADLVLLDANPLEDISNTQALAAVVLRGQYLDREALDALLEGAERAANAAQTPDTVHVAAPTGDRETDLESLLAAFEHVRPGGTIAFAGGTYLVGSEGLVLRTPGVRLEGHPDGSTLVGCTAEERADLDTGEVYEVCNGFMLAAEEQRVRDLRFESFNTALYLPEPTAVGPATGEDGPERPPSFTGGHVIEDNSFQDVGSVDVALDADSMVWIRQNVFRNTWHAVVLSGRNIRMIDNLISAPETERIPGGFTGVAVGIRPHVNGTCSDIVVEGNRIEGHTDGVIIAVLPQDMPGAACSDITVRANEIVMQPLLYPEDSDRRDRAGRLAIAPAIRLINAQRAVSEGAIDWPERWMPEGGWPAKLAEGRVSNVLVEGNRISGAVGVAIELVYASDSRIIDNEIEVRPATTPAERDGLTLGGNLGPGLWVELGLVDEVNGTPVWLSPGSAGNVVRNPQ